MKTKIKFKNLFLTAYYFAMICLLVLPMFKYTVPYVPIIMFTLPFMALYCISYKNALKNVMIFLIALVMMFVFGFLVNSTFRINQSINFSIISYLCFVPFFMFDYVIQSNDKQLSKMILTVSLLIFAYLFFVTMKELMVNPLAARQLASGKTDDLYLNSLRKKNVGGFGVAYALSMFIPYVAMKITSARGKKKFYLITALIILMIFAFYCQYTTLLIIAIAACMLIFAFYSRNVIVKVSLIVVGVSLLIGMRYIFKFLAFHLPFETLSQHFYSMYSTLVSGEETTSRWKYTKACIVMFLKHPFFGVNTLDSYNSFYLTHGHSTYFPLLASKGLVGSSFFFAVTYLTIKNILVKFSSVKDLVPMIISYIVLGMVNPNHSSEISVVVFLVIPLMEYMIQKNKEEKMLYVGM